MARADTVTLNAAAVEAARLNRLLSRADLARRSKVSSFTVWAAHHGRRISLRSAKQIAAALRFSLRSLLVAAPVEGDKPDFLGRAFGDRESIHDDAGN